MRPAKIFNEISEAVFPSGIYCIVCGSMIDRSRPYAVCDDCVKRMHWINGREGGICTKCGKALPAAYTASRCYDCIKAEHEFTKGFSCLTYGLHEREIMMDIKYGGKGYMAVSMGDIMFDRMYPELNLTGSAGLEKLYYGKREGLIIDIIIPVPVSPGRLSKRGYNQSGVMAKQFRKSWQSEIAEVTELSNGVVKAPRCDEHILFRTRQTPMLRSLSPAERALALRDAFAVKKGTEQRIKGKSVLLIDDIYTTGATCDACSRALRSAGARKVYILTLCIGGNRKPDDESNDKPADDNLN